VRVKAEDAALSRQGIGNPGLDLKFKFIYGERIKAGVSSQSSVARSQESVVSIAAVDVFFMCRGLWLFAMIAIIPVFLLLDENSSRLTRNRRFSGRGYDSGICHA
jgi:hypothetical protein